MDTVSLIITIVSYIIIGFIAVYFTQIIFKLATKERCTSRAKLHGKTVLLTEAISGIGKKTAIDMASRGARVIFGCKTLKLGIKTAEEIIATTGNTNLFIYPLDFESLSSVRKFSQLVHDNETKLDVLINNAASSELGPEITEDGLHITMQVNHFGPFLLTNLLLDLLKKSPSSRIVTFSSFLHVFASFDSDNLNAPASYLKHYYNSKLCNILMSNELARKLAGTNVTSNSLHSCSSPPPERRTKWYHWSLKFIDYWEMFKDYIDGAQTTIHCAVCEELEGITGKYFYNCTEHSTSIAAQDQQLSEKVWNESMRLVKLKRNEIHY